MFGALGLFRSLSALGKGSSRTPLPKIRKKLPEAARLEFEALLAAKKDRMTAVKAESDAAMNLFLAQYGFGPRPDYAKERAVVGQFILGQPGSVVDESSGRTLSSDGRGLFVDGRKVASRSGGAFSRFLEVCPGDFGGDKTHRRAANALLSVIGAGIKFSDREDSTFIAASHGRTGRLVAPAGCYRVEVSKKLREAANAAALELDVAIAESQWEKSEMDRFSGVRRRKSRRSRR